MSARRGIAAAALLVSGLLAACGDRAAEVAIPAYPNATPTESMAQEGLFGIVSGELQQATTTDPFDRVLEFYVDALADAEISSHRTELGRQAALAVRDGGGSATVAIQEFTDENRVVVTVMRLRK